MTSDKTLTPEGVYKNVESKNDMEPDRIYPENKFITVNGELRSPENSFSTTPAAIYKDGERNNDIYSLGDAYPNTNGDFIMQPKLDLGNMKPADKYNISLGDKNPDDYDEQ